MTSAEPHATDRTALACATDGTDRRSRSERISVLLDAVTTEDGRYRLGERLRHFGMATSWERVVKAADEHTRAPARETDSAVAPATLSGERLTCPETVPAGTARSSWPSRVTNRPWRRRAPGRFRSPTRGRNRPSPCCDRDCRG